MKILIITAWYHPFIHPRAHRWTAVAEQWSAEGHEVHVLTARVRERRRSERTHGVQIHRAGFDSLKEWVYHLVGSRQARGRVGVPPGKPRRVASMAAWIYNTVWKNLFFPDDACIWYFPARKRMQQLLENERFDAIVTVSLPFTGHLLGLATHLGSLRTSTGGTPAPFWLADIGDPFSFQAKPPNNPLFYNKKNLRFERQILETADAVTVTTEATLNKYREVFGEKSVAKMRVVPPVLTPPDLKNRPFSTVSSPRPQGSSASNTKILRIGYFGALYAPTRTPDVFLDLLAQSFAMRPDLRQRLEIHFYGEIFPEFFEKLHAAAIQLHGLCSREATWIAMREMDILLNIGNVTEYQLPSKAVDYLATGKPILNLSYVENDPFAEFFREHPGVLKLKIENGKVGRAEMAHWLEWLEGEKPILSEAEILERIAPFLVRNVAQQYLTIIS